MNLPFSLPLSTNAQQAINNETWTVGKSQYANTKNGLGWTDESDMTPPTTSTYPECPLSLHPDPHAMISILDQITFLKQRNKVPPHYPINNSQKP